MEFFKIQEIISSHLDIPKDSFDDSTRFREDLLVDSLTIFQIFTAVEMFYEMEFSEKAYTNIKTIGELKKTVEDALSE